MNFKDKQNARGGTRNMSRLRPRFTYANVVATLALVFAMTGGAYAASKFLITSTKQIKPSVLSQLKGKAGAKGASGAAGPAGPAGSQGPAGANGKDGAPGANGTNGESVASAEIKTSEAACGKLGGSKFTVGGKETTACNGKEGKPGSIHPGETLPSEASETGTWSIDQRPAADPRALASISFPIPLKAELTAAKVHIIEIEGEEPKPGHGQGGGTCPTSSSVSKPEAEPGNLCIFIGLQEKVEAWTIVNPTLLAGGEQTGASTTGTNLAVAIAEGTSEEPSLAVGTWAVTAE